MNGMTRWTWPMLFGSIWGLSEVIGGEALYGLGVPRASIWLTVIALLILTIGRGVVDRVGSSALAGVVAAFFKLAATAPHYCHLLAIVGLAVVFDITATASGRLGRQDLRRPVAVAAISAVAGAANFAILARYVVVFPHWIEGGFAMVARHVLVSGGVSAVVAACLAPLALGVGQRAAVRLDQGPRRALALSMTATAAIWLLVVVG